MSLREFNSGERRLDSPLDPVLDGVAQGLASLFPPVESTQSGDDGRFLQHPFEIGYDESDMTETHARP